MQNELHAEWVTFLHKKQLLCGSMSGHLLALKMAAFLHQKRLLCGSKSGCFLAIKVSTFWAKWRLLFVQESGCFYCKSAAIFWATWWPFLVHRSSCLWCCFLCKNASPFGARKRMLCCTKRGFLWLKKRQESGRFCAQKATPKAAAFLHQHQEKWISPIDRANLHSIP